MNKDELLRLIDQAAREGWTSLDLSNQGLTELPPEIGKLTNLEVLAIDNNSLTSLPSEFGNLINLQRLRLGRNKLSKLPDTFNKLKNLKSLELSSNQFVSIPYEILELPNITQLYLSANRLESLPSEIRNLSKLKIFFINANRLSGVPREIKELRNLTALYLNSNQITRLPPEIQSLTNLFTLNLKGNPLPIPFDIVGRTDEPDKIITYYFKHLSEQHETIDSPVSLSFSVGTELHQIIVQAAQTKLRFLDLSHKDITSLPETIGELVELTELDLSFNKLLNLPKEVRNLINLRRLDLRYNQFLTFPEEIKDLKNLRSIHLGANQLTTIPSFVENFENLESLKIWYNHILIFPIEVCKLTNLIELNLAYNQLKSLPQQIKDLKHLKRLNLTGNPLPIPPEILRLRAEFQKILNYYFQHGPKKPLHEVKVLIVGQGAVGKTSLIKRLLDDSFNPHETKTDGIAINQWHLPVPSTAHSTSSGQDSGSADIRLNLWDFGGQEIMHATHQFFLTKRSLYVLVLDSRLDEQNNRVEYWLKIIQSFGGDSPIIVVCNKCDEHSLDLNWKGLQEKYPTIKAFAKRLSCKTGEGLMELRSLIAQEVGQLPHLNDELLLTWFAVKTRLEQMEANYIGYNEYQQMCETEQVTDELSQQTLLGFLHDLGIVLHFHDHPILEDTNVLNPEWVTRGIYQLVNSNELFQRKGELERSALAHILPAAEYPRSKHQFILDMMRKFELCFDFAESAGERFLVPDLLSREEPYTGEWGDSLAFQYHYDILPGSVISRFMVRMHAYIHQKTYWRNGVVLLSDDGQNRALIKADTEDRKIFIHVGGHPETRSLFLAIIRADFRKIHATIPKLNLKEVIPLPGHPDVTIDYADLLKLRERGISTYYYPKADAEINVNQLLDGLNPTALKGNATSLPSALQQQMIAFLKRLPNLHDPAGQRALVYSAGLDKNIQDQLQFGLPAAQFVPMLVTLLSGHGRLADGRLALAALLETAKQAVGKDARDECDRLLKAIF